MPFKKIGPNKYRSPTGRMFTKKQVELYYARGGTFSKTKDTASQSCLPDSCSGFSATFTTVTFDHSSLRWLEINN
jgi:hypothetical protein